MTGTRTMTAVVQDRYGEADVLRVDTVARPAIGAGEVLLRVHAAGVDRGVWHLMTGLPYPVRLAGYGMRVPKDPVRGREVAGRVEAVGAGVTGFAPGDEVYGIAEGTFAEYARADAAKLAPRPAGVTAVQASVVPISGSTALQAVRDVGQVRAGQSVLVLGGSGGVGSFAVQVARALGAEVTGVCRTDKTDLVHALGADHVLDHTRGPVTGRYDVVIDTGGHRSLRVLRRLVTPRGRVAIVGSETGGRVLGGFDRSLRAPLYSRFVGPTLAPVMNAENAADLRVLAGMIESGAVVPPVDRTFPLRGAAAAVQYLVDGHVRGKVAVEID